MLAETHTTLTFAYLHWLLRCGKPYYPCPRTPILPTTTLPHGPLQDMQRGLFSISHPAEVDMGQSLLLIVPHAQTIALVYPRHCRYCMGPNLYSAEFD